MCLLNWGSGLGCVCLWCLLFCFLCGGVSGWCLLNGCVLK